MVNITPNVNYRLLNLEAATYLTISTKDNFSIIGQAYAEETAQQWTFQTAGGDAYFIKSANAVPQYLALPSDGSDVAQGQQLQANTSPFVWTVLDVPHMAPAAKMTPAMAPSMYVDLWEADPADGTKIQVWPETGNNQIWILQEVRD